MRRSIGWAAIWAAMALAIPHTVLAEPGTEPQKASRALTGKEGQGVVVISVRSALYLDDPLMVYFVREGGSIANDADVYRFERKQGFLAFGNDTTSFKVRAFKMPAGRYRLVAHGINCPKVPAPEERCLIDVSGVGGKETLSRPSRGYGATAPVFEVRAGHVTEAGDFALTAQNTIEWSEIPAKEMRRMDKRFSAMPKAPGPQVPGEFYLKYGLFPREYADDMDRRF